MENEELPIGTKSGCFTIIGALKEYKEEIEKEIERFSEEDKREFQKGKWSWEHLHKSPLRLRILSTSSGLKYQCKCKCGKIHYLSESTFKEKRHLNCGKGCGRIPREYHSSYNTDYINTIFESLEILECIDDNVEVLESTYKNNRKVATHVIYKSYKCRCYLCGKEYIFRSDAFIINKDEYGYRAKEGYYSDTHCVCRTDISSFQWRTIKILKKYNVKYRVEESFPELYGIGQKELLRFDFVILDSDNNIKYLLECQGEQHYKPVEKFGGVRAYEIQVQNDELKRMYANAQKIALIEIPYTYNTLEKEEIFLKERGII